MKKVKSTLLMFVMSVSYLLAQVPPPPDYNENATPGVPSPIDQYVYYLVGLALLVGIYFVWNKKKLINQL